MRTWVSQLLTTGVLVASCSPGLSAEETEAVLGKVVKVTLMFEEDIDQVRRYPNLIRIYLRLENARDGDVTWVANRKLGVNAEVLDAHGEPVKEPPRMTSIQSNLAAYRLSYGSRMEWLISSGGIAMEGDAQNSYAVVIGTKGWLLPKDNIGGYSIRVRVNGWAFRDRVPAGGSEPQKVLFEVPATKIRFEK